MIQRPFQPRRVLAALAVVAVAAGLAACSRKDKVFNPPVSGPITWGNTVHHLLADRSEGTAPTGCTSCHHTGTGIPDWSSYATVYAYRLSIRSRLSPGGTMRQFLKTGEPEVVIGWIDAGAPQ
jgi:hypothetical protein